MVKIEFDPFPEIETERLSLVRVNNTHLEALFEMLSDPKVAEFDYFYPIDCIDKGLDFIKRFDNELKNRQEITWGICLKETGKLIGTCGLGNFDMPARRAELGYALNRSEWNKGYATEALKGVLDYAFNQMCINRVEAMVTPGNNSSLRVLEKLNFQREGLVRERDFIKGQLVDGIIMGLLARHHEGYVVKDNKQTIDNI